MTTKLIGLSDGLLAELETDEDAVQQISVDSADRAERDLNGAQSLLKKAVQPVVSAWDELKKDLTNETVVIQLALGFEAEGDLFVASGTGTANISYTLTSTVVARTGILNINRHCRCRPLPRQKDGLRHCSIQFAEYLSRCLSIFPVKFISIA